MSSQFKTRHSAAYTLRGPAEMAVLTALIGGAAIITEAMQNANIKYRLDPQLFQVALGDLADSGVVVIDGPRAWLTGHEQRTPREDAVARILSLAAQVTDPMLSLVLREAVYGDAVPEDGAE